jgi:hypothetical protein
LNPNYSPFLAAGMTTNAIQSAKRFWTPPDDWQRILEES